MSNQKSFSRNLAIAFGRPFGVAFAAFLRELSDATGTELQKMATLGKTIGCPDAETELHDEPIERRGAEERAAADAAWAEVQQLEDDGKLLKLELDRFTPESVVANRLRQVLKDEGISQADLARRLSISPAVISRMLKDPDRSAVKTLRRVAEALQVDVHEIIDRSSVGT
jgi:DNA-binding Xre family transcriptional regulator